MNDKSKYNTFILKIAFKNFVFKVLAILFRHHYKIILDMDGALGTEQSAFRPIKQAADANQSLLITYSTMKNVQSGIRFGGISYIFFFSFLFSE